MSTSDPGRLETLTRFREPHSELCRRGVNPAYACHGVLSPVRVGALGQRDLQRVARELQFLPRKQPRAVSAAELCLHGKSLCGDAPPTAPRSSGTAREPDRATVWAFASQRQTATSLPTRALLLRLRRARQVAGRGIDPFGAPFSFLADARPIFVESASERDPAGSSPLRCFSLGTTSNAGGICGDSVFLVTDASTHPTRAVSAASRARSSRVHLAQSIPRRSRPSRFLKRRGHCFQLRPRFQVQCRPQSGPKDKSEQTVENNCKQPPIHSRRPLDRTRASTRR